MNTHPRNLTPGSCVPSFLLIYSSSCTFKFEFRILLLPTLTARDDGMPRMKNTPEQCVFSSTSGVVNMAMFATMTQHYTNFRSQAADKKISYNAFSKFSVVNSPEHLQTLANTFSESFCKFPRCHQKPSRGDNSPVPQPRFLASLVGGQQLKFVFYICNHRGEVV